MSRQYSTDTLLDIKEEEREAKKSIGTSMYPSWRRPTSVTTPSPDRQSVACAQQGAVKSHEVKGAPAVRNPLANGNASAVIKLPQAAWAAGAALAPAGAVLDKRLRRPPPLPPRAALRWASARLLAALAYRCRREPQATVLVVVTAPPAQASPPPPPPSGPFQCGGRRGGYRRSERIGWADFRCDTPRLSLGRKVWWYHRR